MGRVDAEDLYKIVKKLQMGQFQKSKCSHGRNVYTEHRKLQKFCK